MLNNISVGKRLFALTCLALVITLSVMISGLVSLKTMHDEIKTLETKNMVAMNALGLMNGTVGKMIADILLAFQHDPAGSMAVLHGDHPISLHTDSAAMWRNFLETNLAIYKTIPLTEEEKKHFAVFESNYNDFVKNIALPTIQKLHDGDYSANLMREFLVGFMQHAEALELSLSRLLELQRKYTSETSARTEALYDSTVFWELALTLIGALLCMAIAYAIIRSITHPLLATRQGMEEIARTGNFTHRVPITSKDEVGQSAAAFNTLVASVQQSIKTVLEKVDSLDQAASSLVGLAEQSASRSVITSASTSEIFASIEEMTGSIHSVSDNAKETSDLTGQTGQLSQKGSEITQKTINEMQGMQEVVLNSSRIITELGKQSEEISGIVQVIREVADQTNLLALNAAIEAARAGEQGRGFAVVADEVRKLAERTANATGEIRAMIDAIQTSSRAAVDAMHTASERVESGVALADEVGKSITAVQESTQQTLHHTQEISLALSEQDIANQNMSQQVAKVAQAAEEDSAAAHQSSEAALNIEKLTKEMRAVMEKYQV
ncbi:MAG: methyl-accepting chemotaxis protein [Zoogloeaceae bacterium]|jgi:methyl-accepting chemotaxis protein|nr:methyl-accepting chemotaxis protein [Zoogloeaceae bacterium]